MIEVKNYTKIYSGDKKAVDNVSFTANTGEIFAFIGHNGAGKTTTLRAIAGILKFEEGDILINGKSIKTDPIECKMQMAYIPDNPDLYENMKAIDYINFICDMYGISLEERKKNIEKYASLFELTDKLEDTISSYSHGMKQKVALTAALAHNPKVIIMDEPFVGLDPKAIYEMKKLLKEMCKNEGTTILFSTHILEVAEELCDKVGIIKKGKLIKTGSMKEVKGDTSLEKVFLELEDK